MYEYVSVRLNVSDWPVEQRAVAEQPTGNSVEAGLSAAVAELLGMPESDVTVQCFSFGPTRVDYGPAGSADPTERVMPVVASAVRAFWAGFNARVRVVQVETYARGEGNRDYEYTYTGAEHAFKTDDEIRGESEDRAVRSRWGRHASYYPGSGPGGYVGRACEDGSRSVIADRVVVNSEIL